MMTKKERQQHEKTLILEFEKAKRKLKSFPVAERRKMQKILTEMLQKARKINKPGINLWDARIHYRNGKASEAEKKLLQKYRAQVKDFDEMMDAVIRSFEMNTIFILHRRGADLLEAASLLGKYGGDVSKYSAEEFDRDFDYVNRNHAKIN